MDFLSQLLRGIAFVRALVNRIEGLFGGKPGADKDAAMSFLQNALAMTDAVANREIIDPVEFRSGLSLVIAGQCSVKCLDLVQAAVRLRYPTHRLIELADFLRPIL